MRRTSLKGVRALLERKRTQKRSVLLIGAGRMGSALIKGWIAAGRFSPIHVVEPNPSAALRSLARKRGVILHAALPESPPQLAAVVLAIKPQVLKGEDKLLKILGKSGALVLSIAAGIGTPLLRQKVGRGGPLVRAMPNTPVPSDAASLCFARGESCRLPTARWLRR